MNKFLIILSVLALSLGAFTSCGDDAYCDYRYDTKWVNKSGQWSYWYDLQQRYTPEDLYSHGFIPVEPGDPDYNNYRLSR